MESLIKERKKTDTFKRIKSCGLLESKSKSKENLI